ncbi:hypothetical protein, conserved [Leishmania donovani]|uniref:Uncharacterized protein n=2 Tax=Leishmania donovani TaxID=5661 RepID=E9BBM1_LEIDO|nr:hypothetical protein, conserved [Leishmania donovani]CBZ32646.1 hypothetical protein, conserved [Leishmania donovani]
MTSSLSSSTLRLSHSATMGSTAAAAVTGATEPAVDVSLDEYFEVCQASSSSASSSSSRSSSPSVSEPATRSVGPSSRDAAFGDRSSTTAALQHHHSRGRRNVKPVAAVAADLPTSLRGNVTRPLLQRPRPLRSPFLADVLISIPSTLEDEGLPPHDAAPSRPSTCPCPPFRKPEFVAPPHGSAAAFSRNGAAVRGSAGHLLAECLQHTTLPCVPSLCAPPSCSSAVGHSCAVPPGRASSVFAFHPPPAGTAAARGKKRSSKTITTRGGAGACPSSTSPSTAPRAVAAAQVGCLARQRAVLFDVLCALRQHPTASCEMYSDKGDSRSSAHADLSLASSGGPWRLRDAVLAEAAAKAWPLTFLGALEQLLEVANVVAAVDAHVRECEPALAHHTSRGPTEMHGAFAHDVTEMCGDVQDASVALEATAARSLERLCSVLRQLSADFGRWVLQLQEYLLVVCEGAAAASHLSEHQPPPPLAENVRAALYENEEEAPKAGGGRQYPFRAGSYIASSAGVAATVLPGSCSLADLVAAVRENIVPLQRCHVLVEESGCFEGLVSFDRQSSASRPTATTGAAAASGAGEEAPPRLLSCALLAARLLDTLIIQASAFQDTSTMDLYRLYVMTLLYTAWPYVLLCTAAIFGFVRGIDPPVWRRQLPRLFRSSFSHVRIGDASSRFPTDILSLLLNCVGYYNSDGVAASAAAGERGKGMAQRTSVPSSSSAGRSGDSVGAVWVPGPRQAGAGRSGRRRGEASEQHAARAALTSARAFVLRSLASFTRRHKQIALSRTPMHPRRTSAAPVGVKGHAATTAAAAARTSAGTASCHLWHTKSMKEILHYIMYEAGDRQGDEPGAGDQAGSGTVAAVVAYAQQNQDVRCRVVQVAAPSTAVATVDATGSSNAGDSAGALHYVYFPTTIPLGFASMLAEALAGQQQWQQQRGDCRVSSVADDQGCLAPSLRTSSLGQRKASGGGDGIGRPRSLMWSEDGNAAAASDSNNGDDDGGGSGDEGSSVLRRRGISLWTLAITESDTTPDVRFTNILAGEEEQYLDAADTGSKAFGQGGQAQRKRRSHQLWINVTIPCARWITTALLIPIGVAVQRLQERRLRDLFTLSLHADAGGGGSGCLLSRSLHAPVQEAQQQRQSTDTTAPAERPPSGSLAPLDELAGRGLVSRTATATACSFIQALKLLVDVALCRDQERLVHGFLERLHREPRWWMRHAEDGGAAAYGRLGTAAPVVSAIFADALRGKRFSELVRLSVLPARVGAAAAAVAAASTMTAATLTTPGQQGGRGEEGHSSPPVAADMLDVFASFQLDLTLPDAFQRILQPRDLSVYVQPLTSRTERSYQTYFWQRRQRLYLEEGDAGEGKASPAAAAASGLNGIAFADVWSYVFGYKCALYYARITLREHKKRLQQRDTQDAQAAQAMGLPGHTATQHLRYVSRGLGTAYYTLNFAVEQLLSFTQNVAMRVVYNLERLLAKAMSPSPELLSCMELCYQLDALLLELSIVSFPARPPVALNVRERGMQSPAAEVVRAAVQRALEVALDPSRLPVSHINISTRNAVEALVAAVFAAAESHPSTLATHLKPLVVRLTFNRYYGTDEEIRSFHFR